MSVKLGTVADRWRRYRARHLPYATRCCELCGADFNPRGKQKWCKACQWPSCPECGASFYRTHISRKFCSRSCNGKHPVRLANLQAHRGTKPRTYHLSARNKHGNAFDRDWRTLVFERDNYTCQHCQRRGGRLQADHIKPYKEFPELRHELSNGRTLCVPCHQKTPTYGWSKYWHGKRKEVAAKRMSQEVLAL